MTQVKDLNCRKEWLGPDGALFGGHSIAVTTVTGFFREELFSTLELSTVVG